MITSTLFKYNTHQEWYILYCPPVISDSVVGAPFLPFLYETPLGFGASVDTASLNYIKNVVKKIKNEGRIRDE